MRPPTNTGAQPSRRLNRRDAGRLRLAAQRLTGTPWASAVDAVSAFGLMQAQEYSSVVRSVSLRTARQDDMGELVRGYPMRGTIFLGTRADMGWMTELCAKVKDEPWTFVAMEVFETLFGDGARVTRAEFKETATRVLNAHAGRLPQAPTSYWVLKHLMERRLVYYTGTDQLLESLSLPDIESTFNGDRQAAATELASRYFRTHGPATAEDFHWWTKLPKAMVVQAVSALPEVFLRTSHHIIPDGLEPRSRSVHLLSPYDEYILGYKDRLFAMDQAMHDVLVPKNMGVFRKAIVVDGQVRGTWGPKGIEDHGVPKYARRKVDSLYAAARGRQ